MNFTGYNTYHFIGIGGIGISAIARLLLLQGKTVTGSDNNPSEIIDDLKKLGAKIYIGQKAEKISPKTEIVIYTIAVSEENSELKEAKKRALVCYSYPQALGELSKSMFTLAISGTHGKTTTTAMVGHIMKKAGMDPTIIVGSKLLGENTNFVAGKSKYLIVEACEYRRSFLNLSPKILVITNIEPDHLDYYKNIGDIKKAFKEMEEKVQKDGFVIKDSNYKKVKADFKLLMPGKHNILNAQAAIKTVEKVGVDNVKAKEYLKDFRGTWRRLEFKGQKEGTLYYDDYAHHPTEIRASICALREKHPDRKIICVFEPHQQSRTKIFFRDFVKALKSADRVFVAPIMIAREKDDGETTNQTLANSLSQYVETQAVNNINDLKKYLNDPDKEVPSCIILMGAGNIYKWTEELLK